MSLQIGWDRSVDHIRASSHNGCTQRPDTWLHPNASRIRPISSCTAGAVHTWHIATNGCALNFRSLLGVLRTWMGERPSLRPARMTRCGSRVSQNAVMHNTAFFNDVVGCDPRPEGNAHEATEIYRVTRRRSGRMVIGCARTAAGDAGDRLSRHTVARCGGGASAGISP